MIDQGATRGSIGGVQRRHGLAGSQVAIETECDADVEHGGGAAPCSLHLSGTEGFGKRVITFLRTPDCAFENATVLAVMWSQEVLNVEFALLSRNEFRE